jgi:GAF domain-containing protein
VDHDGGNSGATSDRVVGLAGALLEDDVLHDLLQRLTVLATHTVASAHSVSITVAEDGRYRTSSSSGPEALAIDEAQYRGDDGPCLEAMRSTRQLRAAVGGHDGRWARFEEEATKLGVTGVLSTPLVLSGKAAVGALNIYAREGASFGPADARTAQLIGEHAAILVDRALALLSSTRLNDQLRQAVATREIIGEAKGILMESQSCTRDQAFDILRRASQRENRKLRELAEELVLRVEARTRKSAPRP